MFIAYVQRANSMRSSANRHIKALALIIIMLLSTAVNYENDSVLKESHIMDGEQKSGVTVPDVPVWRVGDKWKYAGTFDPTQLVIDSGVEANVGEINGDSITEVLSITERMSMESLLWFIPLELQPTLINLEYH